MEVVVGPVPAESMAAFARFARGVLHSQGPGADVPSDAASAFDGYLDEWDALAAEGGDVTWVADADIEVAEYLVYAFYRVTQEVSVEAGEVLAVPDDAAPFYWRLVDGLLVAMVAEGGAAEEFAVQLRELWPKADRGDL